LTLPQRLEIKKVTRTKPAEHGSLFPAEPVAAGGVLVAEGGVPGDIKGYAVRKAEVGVPVRHRR
jgi:hypothetical protein